MQKAIHEQVPTQGKRPKTRTRILQAARKLFNERGEANVTLANIGEHLGISEGNVWYHFHTKQDIVYALFLELQERTRENRQRDLSGLENAQIEQLQKLVADGFYLMWEYRFLFRDHISWASTQREMHEQINALTIQGCSFIESLLTQMSQHGLLQIQQHQISSLAINIWIVCRYWIDYCQTRDDLQKGMEQNIQEGIQQVRALVIPYLTVKGRRDFDIN